MQENVVEPKMGMNRLEAPRTPPGGTSEQRVICDVFCKLCSWEVAGVFVCEFRLVVRVFLFRIG